MPIIQIENGLSLTKATKAQLAAEITTAVHDVILSPDDLINVIFHDLPAEDVYRDGKAAAETLIFCHIRGGRSEDAIQTLLIRLSSVWSRITGGNEADIELILGQFPAKHVVRAGKALPEPPIL